MKTIYKIMIAFIAISMMIAPATANNAINWQSFDIASQESAQFSDQPSDHWNMPDNYIDIITDGHTHMMITPDPYIARPFA